MPSSSGTNTLHVNHPPRLPIYLLPSQLPYPSSQILSQIPEIVSVRVIDYYVFLLPAQRICQVQVEIADYGADPT